MTAHNKIELGPCAMALLMRPSETGLTNGSLAEATEIFRNYQAKFLPEGQVAAYRCLQTRIPSNELAVVATSIKMPVPDTLHDSGHLKGATVYLCQEPTNSACLGFVVNPANNEHMDHDQEEN